MTPEFAQAVDPIFEHVLNVLDRIDASDEVDAERERKLIIYLLDKAERGLRQAGLGPEIDAEWKLAKFALSCWIDEMFGERPWGPSGDGQSYFINNPLQREFFSTADGAVEFFVRSKEAARLRNRDALEVFFLCVILGFRGFYRSAKSADLDEGYARQYQLPDTLAEWRASTAEDIRSNRPRQLKPLGYVGPGAEALRGRSRITRSILLSAIMLGILIWVLVLRLWS